MLRQVTKGRKGKEWDGRDSRGKTSVKENKEGKEEKKVWEGRESRGERLRQVKKGRKGKVKEGREQRIEIKASKEERE